MSLLENKAFELVCPETCIGQDGYRIFVARWWSRMYERRCGKFSEDHPSLFWMAVNFFKKAQVYPHMLQRKNCAFRLERVIEPKNENFFNRNYAALHEAAVRPDAGYVDWNDKPKIAAVNVDQDSDVKLVLDKTPHASWWSGLLGGMTGAGIGGFGNAQAKSLVVLEAPHYMPGPEYTAEDLLPLNTLPIVGSEVVLVGRKGRVLEYRGKVTQIKHVVSSHCQTVYRTDRGNCTLDHAYMDVGHGGSGCNRVINPARSKLIK